MFFAYVCCFQDVGLEPQPIALKTNHQAQPKLLYQAAQKHPFHSQMSNFIKRQPKHCKRMKKLLLMVCLQDLGVTAFSFIKECKFFKFTFH
jgi:hypothetical protein